MPTYRVRPGFIHGAFDQYPAGAVLELTETEAGGFLDKLERLPDAPPLGPAADSAPAEDGDEPASATEPSQDEQPAEEQEQAETAEGGKKRKG